VKTGGGFSCFLIVVHKNGVYWKRSLNPPKFVHTLSVRTYQSNQCIKIAVLRNIQQMSRGSKLGNSQDSRGGFFETRFG
jgi:hypothetical protein